MRALDWLARTAMLVLAALATLALIGSLASVSNAPIGEAFPGRIAAPAEPAATGQDIAEVPAAGPAEPRAVERGEGATTIETVGAAPAPAEREVARWLKALTYAVLAVAAVAAAGVVALIRIGSRLAER